VAVRLCKLTKGQKGNTPTTFREFAEKNGNGVLLWPLPNPKTIFHFHFTLFLSAFS
jgi:hypothetical protein